MSRPIAASHYVEHFDPELPHHRAWLLAVMEQRVVHEPHALEVGGTLRRLWTAHQELASAAPPPSPASTPTLTISRGNLLLVPWFAQLDSADDLQNGSSSYGFISSGPNQSTRLASLGVSGLGSAP